MRKLAPRFMTRQIPAATTGEAVVVGIEGRAPRVIVPTEYAAFFYLRGLLGPLMDRRFANDGRLKSIVHDAEQLTRERQGTKA
ncbi:MAG: hypothetical protein IPK93_03555 [Solirubrobacterales bacterium]|nr:hypothetical protein [Solirubrobacterales bacterium]